MPERVVLGGGCFWCTESIFQEVRGVEQVTPGYAGGSMRSPGYYDVAGGTSGHAEVIEVLFDPSEIAFHEILDIFFHTHNPTLLNQQDYDKGEEYRSIVLCSTQDQLSETQKMIQKLQEDGEFDKPIVTEVKMLDAFYPAEDYHKKYYEKNSYQPYCQIIINPKLDKFRKRFKEYLK